MRPGKEEEDGITPGSIYSWVFSTQQVKLELVEGWKCDTESICQLLAVYRVKSWWFFLGFSVKQISEGAGILSSDSVELLFLFIFLLFFVFELALHHFCTNNKISILPNNTNKKNVEAIMCCLSSTHETICVYRKGFAVCITFIIFTDEHYTSLIIFCHKTPATHWSCILIHTDRPHNQLKVCTKSRSICFNY